MVNNSWTAGRSSPARSLTSRVPLDRRGREVILRLVAASGESIVPRFPEGPVAPPERRHGPYTICSQPDRLSAHRRGAHRSVQLAVCPTARGAVHLADRRHGPGAERGAGVAADSGRLSLAGHRLGRRAGGGRAYGPYYQSQRGERYAEAVQQLLAAGLAYRDYARPEEIQAEREAAEREKRHFVYSRRWLAATDAEAARFEAEGAAAWYGSKCRVRAIAVSPTSFGVRWSSSGTTSRTT